MRRKATASSEPDAEDQTSNVPSVALGVLAAVAGIAVLRFAAEVFVPVLLGILISYALEPIVAGGTRLGIPRAPGAAALLLALVGAVGSGAYALGDDAIALLDRVPTAARKLRQTLREVRGSEESTLQKVEAMAVEIEKSAAEAAGVPPPPQGVTRVEIHEKLLDVRGYLWSGPVGLLALGSQAILLVFLAYFLLCSGDLFRQKLLLIAGPSLGRRRVTREVLDEISQQIQRFLFVQLCTSVVVAFVSWLAFRGLGLEQAAMWGIAAGVLNSIPYFGPLIVTSAVALVAFLQFGTPAMTLAVAAASLAITSLEGFLLTPYLMGRAARMNEVAVFIGLLFWSWMWGIMGLLLAVPVLVMIKAVADRVEDLKPVGELLGD
jgi:predicted PurR-regulated permease PerM